MVAYTLYSLFRVTDLLEKNARATADRPDAVVASKFVHFLLYFIRLYGIKVRFDYVGAIFSNGKRILLVGHNERWSECLGFRSTSNFQKANVRIAASPGRLRKALHSTLQPESARNFRPVQEKAARGVITDILSEPEKFQEHISTYAATVCPILIDYATAVFVLTGISTCKQIVVNLGYGRQDKARYSDPDIQKIIVGADRLGQVLRPGAWKIDSFPWLKCKPA